MSKPDEHKTVQSRILAYAQEVGWCYVSRAEADAAHCTAVRIELHDRFAEPLIPDFQLFGVPSFTIQALTVPYRIFCAPTQLDMFTWLITL